MSCRDVYNDFHTMFDSIHLYSRICFVEFQFLFTPFVFICIYWCPTRFAWLMMFVPYITYTTSTSSGTGAAYPHRAPEYSRIIIARSLHFPTHTLFYYSVGATTAQTRLRCSYAKVVDTTILRSSSRSGWPLRNIHFSNDNGSYVPSVCELSILECSFGFL